MKRRIALALIVLGGALALARGPDKAEPPVEPPEAPKLTIRSCQDVVGERWTPSICMNPDLADVWDKLNRRESEVFAAATDETGAAQATERRAFDANLAGCASARDPRQELSRRLVEACIRDRLWVRLRALERTLMPAAATGRYTWHERRRGQGELRIVQIDPDYAAITVTTTTAAGAPGCRIVAPKSWREGGDYVWIGQIDPKDVLSTCDLRIRLFDGEARILGEEPCPHACEADVDYRGAYRLRR
jgi:hypothetical protein